MELSQKKHVEESKERWGLVGKYRWMIGIKEGFLTSGGGKKAEGQGRVEHKMLSMQCSIRPVGHQVREGVRGSRSRVQVWDGVFVRSCDRMGKSWSYRNRQHR